MSIQVTCPGCLKRFSVSEKFAGQKGPCPKCKTVIEIPKLGDEVVIHGGEEFDHAGRDAHGKLIGKPILRIRSGVTRRTMPGSHRQVYLCAVSIAARVHTCSRSGCPLSVCSLRSTIR